MSIALSVENVSKQYRLGLVGSGTLREDLVGWWYRMRGLEDPTLMIGEENDRTKTGVSNYVWALRDINFEVQQGEVLGIIGKNGAGKSTLLKLLSRVTAPTTGSIKAKGRIASLLEVGTGFHPELTGRENIFLNGAIMGMKRHEINRKLDEIVAFAGVERYLDTPVKRYSSGMYVRLAFAVAAHLEPEILIVDEVLAVGDAEFQKKALGKMKDVSSGEGRTVLFVSHNMASVKTLCSRAILMANGKVAADGNTGSVISEYLNLDKTDTSANEVSFNGQFDTDIFSLKSILVKGKGKDSNSPIEEKDEIEISLRIHLKSDEPKRFHITYHLVSETGDTLFSFYPEEQLMNTGVNQISCLVPGSFLQSGNYSLNIFVVRDRNTSIFSEKDIIHFTVVDSKRSMGDFMGREPGYIRPKFIWENSSE
ncbi:MAG: ATP-binding cassette domain-containing protein [Flavobacteriales bacterium]|nr:ATP-binding cassette domain-containing protein [Flavobacteriales bacterium]